MLASILAILAICTLPLSVFAQGVMDGEAVVEHIFDVADTNEDGTLSDDEYTDARLSEYGLTFDQCDTNQDGGLAFDEYLDLYNAHHPPVDDNME